MHIFSFLIKQDTAEKCYFTLNFKTVKNHFCEHCRSLHLALHTDKTCSIGIPLVSVLPVSSGGSFHLLPLVTFITKTWNTMMAIQRDKTYYECKETFLVCVLEIFFSLYKSSEREKKSLHMHNELRENEGFTYYCFGIIQAMTLQCMIWRL